jgi:hypothetical protein
MVGLCFWFLALLGFPQRGGDKAPVPAKAEAKAGRYAPFFKNVDESGTRALGSLTGFRTKTGRCGSAFRENARQNLRRA